MGRLYHVIEEKNKIIIDGLEHFHPKHTFECGQCFRWRRDAQGAYTVVAGKNVARISMIAAPAAPEADAATRLVLEGCSMQDFESVWRHYLDLDRDYAPIKTTLSADPILAEPMRYGWGIRILNQQLLEMVFSFIISSTNRIPKIMRTVERLCSMYGDSFHSTIEGDEDTLYYAFPPVERLAGAQFEHLCDCRAGFRCRYIHETAHMIADGQVDLRNLGEDTSAGTGAAAARAELMKLSGVGVKVADCVLLYSGTRQDVFPTDVWVQRAMGQLYLKDATPAGTVPSVAAIHRFAAERFGDLAGFAQQYLFYYARENNIQY